MDSYPIGSHFAIAVQIMAAWHHKSDMQDGLSAPSYGGGRGRDMEDVMWCLISLVGIRQELKFFNVYIKLVLLCRHFLV